MELKKETLSRIGKCYYNSKYHHSDIKVIMGSLRGTKYHKKETAEELLRLRGEGWRWNVVEDAIDEAHVKKCQPIIDRIFEKESRKLEVIKIENIRKQEFFLYVSIIKRERIEDYYLGFMLDEIHKNLDVGQSFYAKMKISIMTIRHFHIKKKYPPLGQVFDESWRNDISEILRKIKTDNDWFEKAVSINDEIHGDKSNIKPIENNEEYFDDPQWYENQRELSDQYNNRGVADDIRYYCDLDDIDDSNREEF